MAIYGQESPFPWGDQPKIMISSVDSKLVHDRFWIVLTNRYSCELYFHYYKDKWFCLFYRCMITSVILYVTYTFYWDYIGKYYGWLLRMEATETSTTCREEVMTTCRRTAVGMDRAKWTITLTNVVDSNPKALWAHYVKFCHAPHW